jgi:hypothetical protein
MTQGLECGQKSIKIITSEHKYAIYPSRRYFLFPMRLAKTLHHLPQFLKFLRLGCGLASHDHLATHTLTRPRPAGMRVSTFVGSTL